ncbi:MAG: hypothetical protein QOF41_3467 [Methylobacteriaceae bacterium]|nr:hypothetical protein [Methylobacteriaceae bacterium]
MGSYKDVGTVLDAYHQLERGRSVSRLEAAAKRLRALDPANELLPELEAKVETLNCARQAVAFSGSQHDRHLAAEVLV